MMQEQIDIVLKEVNSVLKSSNYHDIVKFCDSVLTAQKIVLFGAGRVGFVMKSFGMRLSHLGINSYFLTDSNIPRTDSRDLLIVGSGSGNTTSVSNIVLLAKQNKLNIICITANPESIVAKNSSSLILLNCQTKEGSDLQRLSLQPMTTIFEQSLYLTLDAIVMVLMNRMNETHHTMLKRHNNLE